MQEKATQQPPGVTLMTEYGVDIPVWHGPGSDRTGCLAAEELTALGVSDRLIERPRAWQERRDHGPLTSSPPRETWPGSPSTVRLARHLQAELPGYRIFLVAGPEPRPIDEWID